MREYFVRHLNLMTLAEGAVLFLAETEKGIRTRKGIGVKRNGPVERFVADWASRPKGEAQAGGCGASV